MQGRYKGVRLFRRKGQFKPRPKNPPGIHEFYSRRLLRVVGGMSYARTLGAAFKGERPPFNVRRYRPL